MHGDLVWQRFPNCRSRPKSGSRSSVKWVPKVILEFILFLLSFICKLDKNTVNLLPLFSELSCKAHNNFDNIWSCHPTLRELHWLPMQARVNVKICLSFIRVLTNSSPSYVSSLVTPCSSLQSRRALRSSSHADFVATCAIRTFGNRAFALANRHHYYHFVKLTSRHTCSKFITTRLSSNTFFYYALLCKMPFV